MIIKDAALTPYIIKLESSAYQIYKKGKRKSSVDGTEKDSERFVASCKDLVSACYYIATLQMEKNKGVTVSLADFLKEVRSIKTEMLKITHDNLEQRLIVIESKLNGKKKQVYTNEEATREYFNIPQVTITDDLEF